MIIKTEFGPGSSAYLIQGNGKDHLSVAGKVRVETVIVRIDKISRHLGYHIHSKELGFLLDMPQNLLYSTEKKAQIECDRRNK
jgi:hypothetical protein